MTSTSGDYQSTEQSILSTNAAVMYYDDASRRWAHAGSTSSLSKVSIYQHMYNTSFRVVGRDLETREVTLNSMISTQLRYNKATETFHQWRDGLNAIYGLNFISVDDADRFSEAMVFSLDTLRSINGIKRSSRSSTSTAEAEQHNGVPGQRDTEPKQQHISNNNNNNNNNVSYADGSNSRVLNNDNGKTTIAEYGEQDHAKIQQKPEVQQQQQQQRQQSEEPLGKPRLGSSRSRSKEGKNSARNQKPPGAPPPPPGAPPPPPPPPPPVLTLPQSEVTPVAEDSRLDRESGGPKLDLASALRTVKLKKVIKMDNDTQPTARQNPTPVASAPGPAGRAPPVVPAKSGDMMAEINRKLAERRIRADTGVNASPVGRPLLERESNTVQSHAVNQVNNYAANHVNRSINDVESVELRVTETPVSSTAPLIISTNSGGPWTPSWDSLRQEIAATIREEVEKAKVEILHAIREEFREHFH